MHAERGVLEASFHRELQLLSSLRDPNIVRYVGWFAESAVLGFIMRGLAGW